MLEAWKSDLGKFASELEMEPPRLVVKRKRFETWWFMESWVSAKPGAWAGRNAIVVSDELLGSPEAVRHYLLAHEIGHIYKKHSTWASIWLACWIVGMTGCWLAGFRFVWEPVGICGIAWL